MSQTIAALDAGTTRINCFIAELDVAGEIQITGIGHEVSSGISKGTVIDMDSAANAIRRSVHRAETMAGTRVDSVFAGLSGNAVNSSYAEASIQVKGRTIEDEDIQNAFDAAGLDQGTIDYALLHAIPISFKLDHAVGIRDPRGM